MKVNLSITPNYLEGYLNICPFPNKDGFTKDRIDNIDKYVDDGEAEEVRVIDVIQYFAGVDSEILFNNWLRKLKHGGKIVLVTTDLLQVCKAVADYSIDIDVANTLIYGSQKEGWQFYKAGFTINQISDYLESKGLKIMKKRTNDYKCILEAVRE